MDEKKKILEMISEGKISPEEGMELLNALGENKEEFIIKKKIYINTHMVPPVIIIRYYVPNVLLQPSSKTLLSSLSETVKK